MHYLKNCPLQVQKNIQNTSLKNLLGQLFMVILACMSLKDKIDSSSVFWRKARSIDNSFSYRLDSG